MTGLVEGKWYAYRVRALNKLGSGKPSRPTDEILAVDPKGKEHICVDTSYGHCLM